jgi:hypothetical protein
MNETQQELQQRSLRNVRALLDKEQEELRRQKQTTRKLLYTLVPAAALVLVVVVWGIPGRGKSASAIDPQQLECQTRLAAERSGKREREIREQEPALSPAEVAGRLRTESAAIRDAAARECQPKPAR